jgi:hypothetical protein
MRRPPIAVALLLVVLPTVLIALIERLAFASTGRPNAHAAATCSDYSNQRDAQRNKDTRDADGNGIYCESLPCPCLKPGSGGGGGGAGTEEPHQLRCTRPVAAKEAGQVESRGR